MENLVIRQGETLELSVKTDDDSATTVQLLATKEGSTFIDKTEPFVNRVAVLRTNDTIIPLGEYEYSLTVVYSDGFIDELPDTQDCEGDCDFPTLTICKSNRSNGIVS